MVLPDAEANRDERHQVERICLPAASVPVDRRFDPTRTALPAVYAAAE